jgi:hypothetical protein
MRYFGQEVFQLAEATSGNLQDPVYLAARAANLDFARNGINLALARGDLDAIVAPTYSFASSPAAVAGYPDISIPIGLTPQGKPAGLWMYSGYLAEPTLLAYTTGIPRHHPCGTSQGGPLRSAGKRGCAGALGQFHCTSAVSPRNG